MTNAATWLVVFGFLLLVLGLVLRTVLMMRSSDAMHPEGRVLYGRQLLRQHRVQFPQNPTPWLMRSALFGGLLLLLAGIGFEISR